MSRLRVFGWLGWRTECPQAPNGSRQTREIMAARSVSEILRTRGISRAEFQHNGDETGNQAEITLALSEPGRIFWRPLDDYRGANWAKGELSAEGPDSKDKTARA